MQIYEAIPELLHRHDVGVVFSMLGGSNVPWVAEGVRRGVYQLVKTRHEETSVHAATGYSRSTGQIGVCTVTRGPGFANSVNGLVSATIRHVPLLLIVSEAPTYSDAEYTEQNVDQKGFTQLIGAGFHHVGSADELESAFWAALKDAYWNGQPQILSIGHGLLPKEIELTDTIPPSLRPQGAPDPESVKAAVDVLEHSKRPLILAGQGAVLADCRSTLEQLADLVGARVATTLSANRFFSGHPHDLGLCGTWTLPILTEYIAEADVVVAFGAALGHRTTAGGHIFEGKKVIQCEIDSAQTFSASSPELGLLGDAGTTAQALIAEWNSRSLPAREITEPTPTYRAAQDSVLAIPVDHDPARGLDLRRVYAAFDRVLPDSRIVVTDSGSSLGTLPALVNARDARSWLIGRGYGSVGLGIGTALGAAAAHPDRPVVLFCGDGGFMMGLSGIDSTRMSNINLTIVIMNDEQLGSEVKHLVKYGLPTDVVRQTLPDIPALAASFGGHGTVLRTQADLDGLTLRGHGLEVFDARTDPTIIGRAVFG